MKILITGAAGFIGEHLSFELHEHGHTVFVIDRQLTAGHELTSPGNIERLLDEHRPDVVVHLAAQVGRAFGEDDLLHTTVQNAGVTALVARACGERGIRLAYASTSEIYGDTDEDNAYEDEQALLQSGDYVGLIPGDRNPHNLYGLSKRWGEEACRLYAPHGLLILRFSMPYGPGLPAGRGRAALVNFLDQACRRVEIPVHAGAERSWCWIGDTTRAVRMLLEGGHKGAWNIGRDDNATSMRRVAELACDLSGAPHDLIREIPAPGAQTVVKRLSTRKLRGIGWTPQVELDEGMARTLAAMVYATPVHA